MATLAEKRPEFSVMKVDIHEAGSPVARQYKIETIPYFKVYGPRGKLLVEGPDAVMWLDGEMEKAGLTGKK